MTSKVASTRKKTTSRKAATARLTPEAQARLAAFRRLMQAKQEMWEQMTPAERREAEMKWRRVVKSINASRARKVFVE